MIQVGVCCSEAHSLLFYPGVKVAYRRYGEALSAMRLGELLGYSILTPEGEQIGFRAFGLNHIIEWFTPYEDCFALQLESGLEDPILYWRSILPGVIRIIREETHSMEAPVFALPIVGSSVEAWHESLIRELFGA